MIDVNQIASIQSLSKFSFYLQPDGRYRIINITSCEALASYIVELPDKTWFFELGGYPADPTVDPTADPDYADICKDWEIFRTRPEYQLGKIDRTNLDTLQDSYEANLIACAFIRANKDTPGRFPDTTIWKTIFKCIDWLRTTDMYTCPASTQYHDSVPGGLVSHTLNVVERTLDLLKAEPFNSQVRVEDAVLVALVHDWCKIGLYDPYTKNVKNEETGVWEKVPAYRYNSDRSFCLGHGVSSMYLAMKFFKLSMEEAAAIRHHMGRWNCPDSEVNELQQANRMFPIVHLLQFADQLSIVRYIR